MRCASMCIAPHSVRNQTSTQCPRLHSRNPSSQNKENDNCTCPTPAKHLRKSPATAGWDDHLESLEPTSWPSPAQFALPARTPFPMRAHHPFVEEKELSEEIRRNAQHVCPGECQGRTQTQTHRQTDRHMHINDQEYKQEQKRKQQRKQTHTHCRCFASLIRDMQCICASVCVASLFGTGD